MIVYRLRVKRYDPATDSEPRYQEYQLESEHEHTALTALRAVYETLDPTLAFRNYRCGRGICTSCRVSLNGKTVKGCETLLDRTGWNVLEPVPGCRVIKDLVVEFEGATEE